MTSREYHVLLKNALAEDAARHDVTSRSVMPRDVRIRAAIIAKQRGVAAGITIAALTFRTLDPSIRCRPRVRGGTAVSAGKTLLIVDGRARSIFGAERTALNFLGHLSGIATLTRRYVERIRGTRARILDTRKTVTGLRVLEKYAVRAGGGQNHRADLAGAVLIKTNHILALSGQRIAYRRALVEAIRQAKRRTRGRRVEVEVRNIPEFRAARVGALPNRLRPIFFEVFLGGTTHSALPT